MTAFAQLGRELESTQHLCLLSTHEIGRTKSIAARQTWHYPYLAIPQLNTLLRDLLCCGGARDVARLLPANTGANHAAKDGWQSTVLPSPTRGQRVVDIRVVAARLTSARTDHAVDLIAVCIAKEQAQVGSAPIPCNEGCCIHVCSRICHVDDDLLTYTRQTPIAAANTVGMSGCLEYSAHPLSIHGLEDASMDLRAFAIGVACGAALYAAATNFMQGDPAASNQSSSQAPAENQQTATATRESGTSEGSAAGHPSSTRIGTFHREEQADAVSTVPGARLGTNFSDVSATRGAPSQSPPDSSANLDVDAQRPFVERARERLLAEPKNISWAYDREFAINQFLSNHPAAAAFEIPYAECRTTHCQIKAIGVDESTGPTWQRIAFDMTRQPWYDFVQHGSSSGTVDGRHVIITDLFTKPPLE